MENRPPSISPSRPPAKPTLKSLQYVVENFPLIDNHAHNLLVPSALETVPFESITSEATGRALRDTFKSLPHLRAVRQLRELYECPEDSDWEDLLEQRIEWLRTNPESLYQKCFAGTHALLIDDGLEQGDKVYEYNWHDRCAKAPSKRIVRIEAVAERLMESLTADGKEKDLKHPTYFTDTWLAFTEDFEKEIHDSVQDPEVAGFKSVICYRAGLDVEPDYEVAATDVGHPFERYVERCVRKKKFRIDRKPLNDYLVLRTLEILSEYPPLSDPDALSKPLQFHTGLGDNDIDLKLSNPAYLQPLIENYTKVPFVLLHSAYPYTREAGYLAMAYSHVFLDIGEIFPMISRDGQKNVLRQALEVVPGSKLLYSTDGHYFPETFWLANKQFREVWLDLMTDYVEQGDLTPHQAINITKDILFYNSNDLYALDYEPEFQELDESQQRTLAWRPRETGSPNQAPRSRESSISPKAQPVSPNDFSFPPPPKEPHVYDVEGFEHFIENNHDIKYVYVQWLDYMATIRTRVLPIKEFSNLVHTGSRIGISQGNTGTLQDDTITPAVNPVGQIYVEPDLRSLRRQHNKDPLAAATVFSFWRDESGHPIRECPRANLETLISDLKFNHNITLLIGFEVEVTFLKRSPAAPQSTTPFSSPDASVIAHHPADQDDHHDTYSPLTTTHAWSTFSPPQWRQLPILAEIASALEESGIEIQQFHAESGPGQYEFVLPPLPPLAAIDTLHQTRQTIAQIAALHDLRATLHPQPFPGTGNAAHAHISLEPPDRDVQFFAGGVLKHLPAICAFTMPEAESYARVKDNTWTSGTYVAWGTQNREVPLRRVKEGRWEMRFIDGFANMYFAVSSILAAGLLGLREGVEADALLETEVRVNPASLTEEQRERFGIKERLPGRLEDALIKLDADAKLREALEDGLVYDYIVMKKREAEMLKGMGEEERREFLIERY